MPSTALTYCSAAGPGAACASTVRGAHGWRSMTPRAASASGLPFVLPRDYLTDEEEALQGYRWPGQAVRRAVMIFRISFCAW
jgi:orotidine-5'-phosphate decarboxylase